jgi:hypothetical protein
MGVAAQPTRTELDAKAAEVSTWRWTADMILLSQKDALEYSEVVRWVRPAAGADHRNGF